MNKILLIIEREFLSRVRKKSFIIMTIVGPLLFAAIMVVPTLLAMMDSSSSFNVAVIDRTQLYQESFKNSNRISFTYLNGKESESPSIYLNADGKPKYDAYLEITDDLLKDKNAIKLYSQDPFTIDGQYEIAGMMERFLKESILSANKSPEIAQVIAQMENAKIKISNITVSKEGAETSNAAEIALGISMILAFLSYGLIIGYGTQVMRGITEEKNNRIVEIIISSVKPFQLMMGKIIGIAMVALTQFLIWIVLTLSIVFVVQTAFLPSVIRDNAEQVQMSQNSTTIENNSGVSELTQSVTNQLKGVNVTYILSLFAFYFIGGYLLYAALFAAVGSAIDPDSDTQQFVMPVMMPLIVAITLAMSAARDPQGSLAFWGSIIPFTSPIVMMARVSYDVPLWQLILSMSLLVLTFVFVTGVAARIYRVGILMYGKKVTYKELWKWMRYK